MSYTLTKNDHWVWLLEMIYENSSLLANECISDSEPILCSKVPVGGEISTTIFSFGHLLAHRVEHH